jgi:hypothetical protein
LRLRRASVWPRSGPWLTSTAYAVLARPCATCAATATSSAFVDRGDTRWDFLGVEPHCLQSIPCYAERSREFGGLLALRNQSLLHRTQGIQWSPACRRGWAWCGGLSIRHLALHRQWRCCHRRHHEGVHEAGRGQRQYDVVKMAEQRGVSAFAWEGHACAPLLDLVHLGWTAPASGTGARRSAVRRHRRRLQRGKWMASNFSVLQRRL